MKQWVVVLALVTFGTTHADNNPSFSEGLATQINAGLIDCGKGSRPSAVGSITTEDGKTWTVPAATSYTTAPHATDLYNECAGIEPRSLANIDLAALPVMDAGGEEVFTAYIFADNYFEFYANGELIAVDAVPFTPFNSSVLKFRADRPVTLAIMGVDWEENLALGSEAGRGKKFQPGDAGVVVMVADQNGNVVSITDNTWRAQTFYTSPLSDRDCMVINGSVRDSSTCSTQGSNSGSGLSAAFWPLPQGWEQPAFDATQWPPAVTFTNDTVGVDNKPAYTRFTELFDNKAHDAQFIWSSNLVLDNLVLMRTQFQ
ncbi:MAG: hypothetical protein AAF404_05360 [Pseudomonadota bacterium]